MATQTIEQLVADTRPEDKLANRTDELLAEVMGQAFNDNLVSVEHVPPSEKQYALIEAVCQQNGWPFPEDMAQLAQASKADISRTIDRIRGRVTTSSTTRAAGLAEAAARFRTTGEIPAEALTTKA